MIWGLPLYITPGACPQSIDFFATSRSQRTNCCKDSSAVNVGITVATEAAGVSVLAEPEAAGGAVAVAGASVAVGAPPDPGVVGVCAGEAGVSVGVDAVRSGPVTPDGSSEPQAASAAVRASARTPLNRVTYLVVRVRVVFFPSRS